MKRFVWLIPVIIVPLSFCSCGKVRKIGKQISDRIEAYKTDQIEKQIQAYDEEKKQQLESDINNIELHVEVQNDYWNEKEQYLKFIEGFVTRHPTSYAGFFQLGSFRQIFYEDNKGAMEAYQKTIKLKPDYASAYMNLALIYMEQNDWDKVVENADIALKYDAGLWMENYLCHYEALDYKRDYKKALELVRKALASQSLNYCDSRKSEFIPRFDRDPLNYKECAFFRRMLNKEVQTLFEMGNKAEAANKCSEIVQLKDISIEKTTIKYCRKIDTEYHPGPFGEFPIGIKDR